ncbi:M28 family metallopeptidase [Rhodobacter calidifons]|uniref:Zn-dependent exopeptidase M28 n=1 Tax=Rhodobacter calidifons TaxID=2715277 RepID=A0ABX0G514_9RHOB|nr:M20/M25/M40 family metallo-hydrolase [Rhodobacter calidifons]NHB75988.1 Zn-dependent exopeptidase M28 [Rhodobacter calidifons]
MPRITRAIVLLDQTSGSLREDDGRILGLDLAPSLRDTAAGLSGVEIILAIPGAADMPGTERLSGLAPAGLRLQPIGPLSYGGLAGLSGGDPATALVSADRRLRGEARAAGFTPAAHPALIPMLAGGQTPVAARMAGPRARLERFAARSGAIPMQFQPAAEGWALIALIPPDAQADAASLGLSFFPLACDPATEDLVWARLDSDVHGQHDDLATALAGRPILYSEPGQILIALKPGETAEAFHLHGGHGHAEFIAPDPGLLLPAMSEAADFDVPDVGKLPEILEAVELDPEIRKILATIRPRCAVVTAGYAADLDRYTGVTALDAAGPIVSRHSAHPDNKRAEAALIADLRAMGYCPWRHDFVHAGATHSNIIADLPGLGRLRIRPEILDRYLRILRDSGPLPPPDRWLPGLDTLAPEAWAEGLADLPDATIRAEIERVLKLQPWFPWWKQRCPLPGFGAGLVIVGAHMDSTAGFEPGYSAPTSPAPGRDDNGSGLAGVLSLARHFRAYAGRLTHTVRFCFFNAEESGLVGSKAYAASLKAAKAPVRGVICMDMIGYNSDANRIFELHAGYTDPAVRDLSLPLADRVALAAAQLGRLAPAQIYKGTSTSGGPDRSVYDGAINRSDHAAFHQQGWGAVLASEDFFMNLASEPAADGNPNYHRAADRTTDTAYARDIVCAVARAVTRLAL